MSRVTEIGVEDVEDRAPQGGGRDATWCDGASLDLLARETGQPAGRVAAGREGLKSRPVAVEDVALREAQRKVGELSMEVDILHALLERKGHPQSPRRCAGQLPVLVAGRVGQRHELVHLQERAH